ncbi:MAG: betaine--homocysteine S-methyltransferase [Chloroflexi bacterium]|nr:betaine--homocysteine S-methyltransferase [Chloroflexota bacterium]
MNLLHQLLQTEPTIVIDGAMGTQLFARGLDNGDPPEVWNTQYPERVQDVHEAYIRAGSRLILTNSFGGTRFRLKLHNLQEQAVALNKAAAEIGRAAADSAPHLVIVAGSIGPTGELLEPMGQMSYDAAVSAFAEQARGLAEGGVDLFWIETMSDLGEVQAAVAGIRSVSDKPICATLTFDTRGRTMMGVTPQAAVNALTEWGVYAIGGNCGNGVEEIEGVIDQMHTAAPEAILIAKSNAGMPQWVNNELLYNGTPAVMADYAHRVRGLGARIIGGCCGSGPEHIAAMSAALTERPAEAVLEARGYQVPAMPETAAEGDGERRRRRRK